MASLVGLVSLWTLPALAVTQAESRLLSELVTAAAAEVPGLSVMSAADVRKAVELEGQKAAFSGCDEALQQCLAEIAGALDARVVLFGSVGSLGELTVLTLNLYDARSGQSAGRAVLREATIEALGTKVDAAVKGLLTTWRTTQGPEPVRLLVLDLDGAGGTASDAVEPEPATAVPWLTVAGGTALGLGALALVVAVVGDGLIATTIDAPIREREVNQVEADKLLEGRESAVAFVLASGATAVVFCVAGGAVLAWGLATE